MKKIIFYLLIFVVLACSSGSKGNGKAMPFSQENLEKWISKIEKVSKNLEPASTVKELIANMKKGYKETCEDLGYDFDATILKMAVEGGMSRNQYYIALYNNIYSRINSLLENNSKEVISSGLLKKETVNKILLFNKYYGVDEDIISFVEDFYTQFKKQAKVSDFLKFLKDRINIKYRKTIKNKSISEICSNSDYIFSFRYEIANSPYDIIDVSSPLNKAFVLKKEDGNIEKINMIDLLCKKGNSFSVMLTDYGKSILENKDKFFWLN
ncbi:hypothetical protein DEFDS_0889 [Deferribacter desulfuricans SSM1]|uniref:Lipoprotein n=1 Tax=Deferribacter desulfuricans (strain DSM 14783 / JCM 11476 / NBRC 101012 / SSM1) TaxID=639282 RepID=D3PCP2_DEFDS|nr:hypothetical protein [Deferribacter desulfuricans]BAI80365.1 hypothetical protein DEFDS_0889 [Deferribacter desulfuricans SSM1]